MITDDSTSCGHNKITFTTDIAHVSGRVRLDNSNPGKSLFDITMYPAASMEPPMNEEGTEWLASFGISVSSSASNDRRSSAAASGSTVSTAESATDWFQTFVARGTLGYPILPVDFAGRMEFIVKSNRLKPVPMAELTHFFFAWQVSHA